MKRIIAAVALFGILALSPVLAMAACTHSTVTDGLYGKTRYCTTCCYGSICNTTCY